MLSQDPYPQHPERITTNFSVEQGKPRIPKGFRLEGAMLPDSPFAEVLTDAPVEPEPEDHIIRGDE